MEAYVQKIQQIESATTSARRIRQHLSRTHKRSRFSRLSLQQQVSGAFVNTNQGRIKATKYTDERLSRLSLQQPVSGAFANTNQGRINVQGSAIESVFFHTHPLDNFTRTERVAHRHNIHRTPGMSLLQASGMFTNTEQASVQKRQIQCTQSDRFPHAMTGHFHGNRARKHADAGWRCLSLLARQMQADHTDTLETSSTHTQGSDICSQSKSSGQISPNPGS